MKVLGMRLPYKGRHVGEEIEYGVERFSHFHLVSRDDVFVPGSHVAQGRAAYLTVLRRSSNPPEGNWLERSPFAVEERWTFCSVRCLRDRYAIRGETNLSRHSYR